MARPVFSTNFVEQHSIPGLSTFLVPAGTVAVLRDMALWLPEDCVPAPGSVLTVTLDTDNVFVWDVAARNIRPGVYRWQGRQPFLGLMEMVAWAWEYSLRASGYLLTAT